MRSVLRAALPVALFGLFFAGLLQLLLLRFEAGDVYPPYSSLRSDPVGTRVLFEALARQDSLAVARGLSPSLPWKDEPAATVFALGLPPHDDPLADPTWDDAARRFLAAGGRLVLAFQAAEGAGRRDAARGKKDGVEAEEREEAEKAERAEKPKKSEEAEPARGLERLGLRLARKPLARPRASGSASVPARTARRVGEGPGLGGLPRELPWHGLFAIEALDPGWSVLYEVDGAPVAAERAWGHGRVVVATDAYLLSNEAMRRDRKAAFVAYLVGEKRRVVFDETALGVGEAPGVSTLLRRYRLGRVAAVVLLLFALFAWRSVSPFLPSAGAARDDAPVAGRDAHRGLVGLVKRGLPEGALLSVAFSEWRKAPPEAAAAHAAEMEAYLARGAPAGRERVLDVYRELCRLAGGGRGTNRKAEP